MVASRFRATDLGPLLSPPVFDDCSALCAWCCPRTWLRSISSMVGLGASTMTCAGASTIVGVGLLSFSVA